MSKEAEKKWPAKRPTPIKRDIQNEKNRLRNKAFKSSVRTAMRQFESSLPKNNTAEIQDNLNTLYSLMDKGVKRGVYKINKASRTKMRLAARVAKV